ncbi:MAG TPA: F0F1 ATP synthase subunit A [Chloroflexota bacterium]|jgi:F-type H+-transporting ATPase subunit a
MTVSLGRETVFSVLGMPVTTTVVTTWVMLLLLTVLAVLAGRSLKETPSGWQAILEWGVTSLSRLLEEMTGDSQRYLPLVMSIGVFVLAANLSGALPTVQAPTADINTPIALALIVFFSVHYFGIRQRGLWSYLASFARPNPILLPFNILSTLTRTVSLAIRLFGNMLSHQVIVAILLLILPLVVPAVLEVFGLLIGVLQAYIFMILTIVYVGGAVRGETGG